MKNGWREKGREGGRVKIEDSMTHESDGTTKVYSQISQKTIL